MKIKEGFLLGQVAGQNVVLPDADALDLKTMFILNDTGAFLWEKMESETTEEDLVKALLAEYEDVDEATAKTAVAGFIKKLSDNGFLA